MIDPDGPGRSARCPSRSPGRRRALNTELLRFCARRGRADHHVRTAGHTDAGVRGRRRWRRERPRRSRTSSRTSSRSSCRPERRKKQAAEQLEAAQRNRRRSWTPRSTERRSGRGAAATDAADALDAARPRSRPRSVSPRRRPATSDLAQTCEDLETRLAEASARGRRGRQAAQAQACRDFLNAVDDVTTAQAALDVGGGVARLARTDVSDGQLLFELICARCHTKGWSIFDPTEPNSTRRARAARRRRRTGRRHRLQPARRCDDAPVRCRPQPGTIGFDAQVEFITHRFRSANKQYGNGGIGSGRMPGFVDMLTDEMIEEIVDVRARRSRSTTYSRHDDHDRRTTPTTATTTTTGG